MLNAGDLDPLFGMGGKALTDFVGPIAATAKATAIETDGKIIVAGSGGETGTFRTTLARYLPDRSLDTSFGTGGRVSDPFFATSHGPADMALQQDGKIILVGAEPGNPAISGSSIFAVVRYNADGSLDTSFGAGGEVRTDFGNAISSATGVVVQSDGRIIVDGSAGMGNLALARYTSDGSLDPTFGMAGEVIATNFHPSNLVLQTDGKILVAGGSAVLRYNIDGSLDQLLGVGTPLHMDRLALQPDGRIVTFGSYTLPYRPYSTFYGLQRLNSDGTLDTSFGKNGEVDEFTSTFIIQPDGKIDLIRFDPGTFNVIVSRLNQDGSTDMTFGTAGSASADIGALAGADSPAIAVQADGKILAVGTYHKSVLSQLALVRFNGDGTVDSTFGTGGTVTTGGFVGTVNATVSRVSLQPDGKILVAGGFPSSVVLARFNPDGSLDTSFGNGGRLVDSDIASGYFSVSPRALVLQPDGNFLLLLQDRLKRYHADGSADPTFHADLTSTAPATLAVQTDGKIIVVGSTIQRLNPDGSPDTTFGANGAVPVNYSITGVAIQADGKILVMSPQNVNGSKYYTLLARYNPDGSLDTGFGVGGVVTVFPGQASSVAVQPDGKIVIGTSPVARFNPDGSPDEFFGRDGRASLFSSGNVAISPDGRIVLGNGGGPGTIVLKANGTLDVRYGYAGASVADFPTADFAVQPDGKIVVGGTTTVAGHTFFTVARYVTTGSSNLSPNQLFVAQVYADLLQRFVDPTGLAYWSGQLDQGLSRVQFVQEVESSQEYRQSIVLDLYLRVLGRGPDGFGNDTWLAFLNNGGTAEQLEAYLLGSDEYFSRFGAGSNAGFLQAVYQLVLHRPIDASGSQNWGQELAAGTSRVAVATAILASLESDRVETEALYANWLHRPVDPSGLDTFTNVLQQGVANETAIAIIMGSDEYFANT